MSPELEVLKDVTTRLERAGFRYMLTGSMALTCYAPPRMTRDIDLVVELEAADAGSVIALFSPDYYVSDSDVARALSESGMFNVLHNRASVKVDLIVRKNEPYRLQELERRKRTSVEGFDVWVVSREDLAISENASSCDTTPEFQQMFDARLMAMSPGERMTIAASMFDTACALVESSFPQGLDEMERRRMICERFYGKELADKAYPR